MPRETDGDEAAACPAEAAQAPTPSRLLDAAERLFGERGFDGTSLRAVAEAAGANIAAVNYHFGSKDRLLRAVVARAMGPVNADRHRRLDTLEARYVHPTIAQLVRAFVEPGLDLINHHGERGPAVARFVGGVLFDPSPRIRQLFAEQVDPVEGRYLDALRAALPDQAPDGVLFGYTSMLGLLALRQRGALADVGWRGPRDGASDRAAGGALERERLVAFLTAGFTDLARPPSAAGD